MTLRIGLGTVLAVAISWTVNHSIMWAILHGLFGWTYIAYYIVMKYIV